MRRLLAGLVLLLAVAPVAASPLRPADLISTAAALNWIDGYRAGPDVKGVPAAMRALSQLGAFDNPEHCGAYVGFLAGVIASNPDRADRLIAQMLPMRPQDRWIIVRAIAYSGLPDWQALLRRFETRLPRYHALSEKYLMGKEPTLAQFTVPPAPTFFDRFRDHFRIGKPAPHKVALEPSPDVIDVFWGYYFATGDYAPVMHIVALLSWSKDHDDVERLTIGSMAKYTLARNATHDEVLLDMLRASIKAPNQPKATVAVLRQVVDAAEAVDTTEIHNEALASIAALQRTGPAYKRNVSWWGYLGQSAIAGGCIAAALAGQAEFGVPCVVGGATASAAMNFWNNQP
jgi:hypothetical protein